MTGRTSENRLAARRPLVSATLFFAAGILSAAFSPLRWIWPAALGLFTLLYCTSRRPLWGAVALLSAFAASGAAYYAASARPSTDDLAYWAPDLVTVTGAIASEVEVDSAGSARFVLRACSLRRGQSAEMSAGGFAQTRVPLSEVAAAPAYGESLSIHGRLDLPTEQRNPGAPDYRDYLARKGIYSVLSARRPADWQKLAGPASGALLPRLALKVRRSIFQSGQAHLSPVAAAVLNGVLFGSRADLPGRLRDDFERTGTTHILATAGLHVGMVAALLLCTLRGLGVRGRLQPVLLGCGLVLYWLMAGGRPSVTRAVVMALFFLLARLVERDADVFDALTAAAFALLLLNPRDLFDPGFHLSFATVLTLALTLPLAEEWLRRIGPDLRERRIRVRVTRRTLQTGAACFAVAVGAQLGAAPLVAYSFHEVSLVAVPVNMLVVPVLTLVIALGVVGASLGPAGSLVYGPLGLLLLYVVSVVQWCSALPLAAVPVASPPWAAVALYYALLWGAACRLRQKAPRHTTTGDPA